MSQPSPPPAHEMRAPHGSVEQREGMLTVYDHEGRYVGCIGEETWENLVADGAENFTESGHSINERRDDQTDPKP